METFADYILSEEDWIKKMEIMHYLQQKTGIFFDKTVIFKTYLAKMFLENADIGLDKNLIITACLLCNCKKAKGPQDLEKIKTYAKEGAEYLSKLGFSSRFCKICEEVNRYSGSLPREKESDILELVDNFGGMLLDRPERIAFKVDEALVLLEYRNLKDKNNRYLPQFKQFVNEMQEVTSMRQLKPVIQDSADRMNDSTIDGNIQAIKAIELIDKATQQAVQEHSAQKELNASSQNRSDTIVTGEQIRKEINREIGD